MKDEIIGEEDRWIVQDKDEWVGEYRSNVPSSQKMNRVSVFEDGMDQGSMVISQVETWFGVD